MLYQNFRESLARAKERANAPSKADSFMTDLLHASAGRGKVDGITTFRPFYVAAKWLEQDLAAQTITEGGGAKFTGMVRPIKSLFDLQWGLDQNLDVPPGFEVPDPRPVPEPRTRSELEAVYKSSVSVLRQLQPRRRSP